MLFITITDEFIQDLYDKAIETLTYVSLEPIEGSYLTIGSQFFLHQPARLCPAQVKPNTKPTLRPRRRSLLLARSGIRSNDDVSSH